MITLQSGKTDKIIVTDATSIPPTPVDPVPDPEEIVEEIYVNWYALNSFSLINKRILIKRNMLGTSIEVFLSEEDWVIPDDVNIHSFYVTPTTVQVTQTEYNVLSIQIPTEVLEENIGLDVYFDFIFYQDIVKSESINTIL